MKVRALFTGFDLTEGKIYEVIFEYDTVYELQCDTGIYCRNKNFFEVVEQRNPRGDIIFPRKRNSSNCVK